MRKFKKLIVLVIAITVLITEQVPVSAVTYANFVYNKKLSLRVYETGEVKLIYKKKKYKLADESACRFACFDKKGTVYLLMRNDALYGWDYKKQDEVELIRIVDEVSSVTTNDYGYVTGYKRYNQKEYKLTKKRKKKLWKKALENK